MFYTAGSAVCSTYGKTVVRFVGKKNKTLMKLQATIKRINQITKQISSRSFGMPSLKEGPVMTPEKSSYNWRSTLKDQRMETTKE